MYLLAKSGSHWPAILIDFQNYEQRFTIPKSRTWLTEKQKEEEGEQEEHRQLSSVTRFT